MVILSFWIHELGLGGRSKLVQNILYLVVCFFDETLYKCLYN